MNDIINRNKNGKLEINSLSLDFLLMDIFCEAKTEEEIEFIRNTLLEFLEAYVEDLMEEKEQQDGKMD